MFGIGLPEMIVIFVVALIVVGPDKLPDLARSLAKGIFELKRSLNEVRGNFAEEEQAVHSVQEDLRKTADELRQRVLFNEAPGQEWHEAWRGDDGAKNPRPYEEKTLPAPETPGIIDVDCTASKDGPGVETGPDAGFAEENAAIAASHERPDEGKNPPFPEQGADQPQDAPPAA